MIYCKYLIFFVFLSFFSNCLFSCNLDETRFDIGALETSLFNPIGGDFGFVEVYVETRDSKPDITQDFGPLERKAFELINILYCFFDIDDETDFKAFKAAVQLVRIGYDNLETEHTRQAKMYLKAALNLQKIGIDNFDGDELMCALHASNIPIQSQSTLVAISELKKMGYQRFPLLDVRVFEKIQALGIEMPTKVQMIAAKQMHNLGMDDFSLIELTAGFFLVK